SESPLKNKAKRTKLAKGQQTLQHFFSESPRKSQLSTSKTTAQEISSPSASLVIDVDALDESGEEITRPTGNTSNSLVLPGAEPGPERKIMTVVAGIPTSQSDPIVYDDLTYDPTTQMVIQKPWSSISVPYSFLAHTLSSLTQTRSRIAINNILTNCLYCIIQHDCQSLLPALYLLSNTLAPPYTPLELGLGPSIISRSIQNVSGLNASALKRLYTTTGDPGDVAFAAKSNLRTLLPHPPLLVPFVYESLLKIARSKGQGTTREKEKIVEKLLLAANGEEIRFLTRTLCQNLRVGAVRTTILSALSRAMVLTPVTHFHAEPSESSLHITTGSPSVGELAVKFKEAEGLIKRVYVQHPNYADIVMGLLSGGLDALETRVHLTIGTMHVLKSIPLHPMLGSPTRSLDEVYDICQARPFVAEYKYDGQRAQIHGLICGGGVSVSLFSRHLEDMTSKTHQYPDVVEYIRAFFEDHPETTSFIMDAEIVSIDSQGGLRSFQELSNRARKSVQLQDVQVLVSIFAFDLMYLNEEIARFNHVESCESTNGRVAMESFLLKAIDSHCEGLMIKLLDNEPTQEDVDKNKTRRKALPATYEPDKRTTAWLKLKKDYVASLGDSLDLIPIGAWHGNGRKAQWWSPILLGLWQPDSGQIVAVCKCMSGLSDMLEAYVVPLILSQASQTLSISIISKDLKERYPLSETSSTCSQQPLWDCEMGGLIPEVYFKPMEVWEIRGAEYATTFSIYRNFPAHAFVAFSITLSPVSVAAKGLVSFARGLSIRFPRFIKAREDKSIENASTPRFLAELWRNQTEKVTSGNFNDDGELFDVQLGSDGHSDSEHSILSEK
ncbi:hypothetical protein H0H93_005805, partial [Arthromyces matolae]